MTAGRDVTGNAFDEWLLPVHPDATAERDRRRAATREADTEEATGHLLARPGRRRPQSRPHAADLLGSRHARLAPQPFHAPNGLPGSPPRSRHRTPHHHDRIHPRRPPQTPTHRRRHPPLRPMAPRNTPPPRPSHEKLRPRPSEAPANKTPSTAPANEDPHGKTTTTKTQTALCPAEDIQPRRARTTLPEAWRPRPLRRPAPGRRPRPGDPNRRSNWRPNWRQDDNRRSAARRPYPLTADTGRRRPELLLLQGGTARTMHLARPGPVARGPFQGHRHDPRRTPHG